LSRLLEETIDCLPDGPARHRQKTAAPQGERKKPSEIDSTTPPAEEARPRRSRLLSALAVGALLSAYAPSDCLAEPNRRFEVIRRFAAEEARQGVAVDRNSFYAVDNRRIGKYDKRSGETLASWSEKEDGPIVHLNSGIVIDGKLHCAHSNYPSVPMTSSIEIFDTETLRHIGSHSFGIYEGSATWIDRRDDSWWVGFAHYEGKGGVPGKGPSWTSLLRFGKKWQRREGFVFPRSVVERFAGRSNSGGAWGPDGLLYATGHDAAEVYVLRPPKSGSTLELLEILPLEATGQGIAWDPAEAGVLYSIVKSRREVVVSRLVGRD
jgi:hypothetical protein